MKCPSCGYELKKRAVKGVELDQCMNCGGIWFDGGEFQNMKDREEDLLRWLDIDLFSDMEKFSGGYSSMVCPKDKKPLYEIRYDNADAKIDVCADCRGIWMDKGEYEIIVAFLKRMVLRDDIAGYLRHLEEEIKEVVNGSEDIVSELRDAYVVFRLLENRVVSQWPKVEEIVVALRTALLK